MKKTMKLFLPILCMIAALVALTLAAAAATETGSCGSNATYTLDTATGVMVISGTGDVRLPQDFGVRMGTTEIIIEKGVTSIGYYGIHRYEKLESVTVPESLSHVDQNAFVGCTRLAAVRIKSLERWAEIWFESADANPLYYAHHLYLDDEELTVLNLPAGTRQIGAYAFCGGTAFTAVTIPASVKYVGYGVFGGCTSLASITVDRENKNYVEEGGVLLTADRTKLISAAPGAIGSAYTLPDTVESIGTGAFCGCRALMNITMPAGVRFIGKDAFAETGWYDAQPNGLLMLGSCVIGYRGEMPEGTRLELAEGTTCIADFAFDKQRNLVAVSIPASVTNIGYFAFYNTGVGTVYIEDLDAWCNIYFNNETYFTPAWRSRGADLYLNGRGVRKLTIPEGTAKIRRYTFANIKNIADVVIPDSVTTVEKMAFYGSGLYDSPQRGVIYAGSWAVDSPIYDEPPAELTFVPGTVGIAEEAFDFKSGIQSVTFPASLQYIGDRAFFRCGLRTVTFEEGSKLSVIGRSSFSGNASLEEVDLPDTVKEVGGGAFADCGALVRVTFRNRDCTIADFAYTVSEQAEICGWRGSTAEAYAKKYGRKFVPLDAQETPKPVEPMTLVEVLKAIADMMKGNDAPTTENVERLLAAVR